jgi:hypothetical protein
VSVFYYGWMTLYTVLVFWDMMESKQKSRTGLWNGSCKKLTKQP